MSGPDAVVLLVRHGRTALNAAGVLRGRLDPPLDDVGEVEAQSLARRLQGFGFTAVVTSPLRRARQTAAVIAGANGTSLVVDPELADRDYGPWDGFAVEELVRRFGSLESAPGIEAADAFTARATAAVIAAAERNPPSVVVVAHDAVNRSVLSCLVPTLGDAVDVAQRTGCWNRLERRGGTWSAPIVDDVSDIPGDRNA